MAAAAQIRVSGSHIFDLQIALIALEHGATEIWTHDRNFVSAPGLPVHDPLPRRTRR
jgi:predicted nucleic acid-binding protein